MDNHRKNSINRRRFFQTTALAGAATGAAVVLPSIGHTTASVKKETSVKRALNPELLLNGTVSVSKPLLAPSQLSFRIGLARTRMSSYPCDLMDFIMIDLERPDNRYRHAYFCNGDLTGRLLEFLSCSEGVDGKHDPRLDELFVRIINQRRSSGYIGRFAAVPGSVAPEDSPERAGASSKHFSGLLRYYELTGDKRALDAAGGLAELLWSVREEWKKKKHVSWVWVIEPLARLWHVTKDPRWLEFSAMVHDNIQPLGEEKTHSHGFMTTIRGLQVMTLLTGDLSWNVLPDKSQRYILEKQLVTPDGNIPEAFPTSARNEGCSIADWILLNLNQGLIHGDENAYEIAERSFWNALAFNQFITGGFGHRRIASNGYGVDNIHEAWWCCTQNGGMAMAEYARHSVTFRHNTIHVNFLTAGDFEIPLPGNKKARITIQTPYPSKAEAIIEAENVPENIMLKIRIPSWVKHPQVDEMRKGNRLKVIFSGKIGHRIEQASPGVILTFGPLILVPPKGVGVGSKLSGKSSDGIPDGYVPHSIPEGIPIIQLDKTADADGFVTLPLCPPDRPLPTWSYFDEGPGSRTWVEGAATEVHLKYPDGSVLPTRFIPMCFSTSCMSLFETPVVFNDVEYS
ncbi:MAG: glycoside hydrolase family 127 protein [Syntrophaceae bacterium]|nr:glycoside hydrolase family 127 protein [Syntrophaceae bacterium]